MDKRDLQELLEQAEGYVDSAMANLITSAQLGKIQADTHAAPGDHLELQEKLRAVLLVNFLFPGVDLPNRELLAVLIFVAEQLRMGQSVDPEVMRGKKRKLFDQAMAELHTAYQEGKEHLQTMDATAVQAAVIKKLISVPDRSTSRHRQSWG